MTQQQKLVQDAISLFRQEGLSALSMGALAKKSGLAKASLFHYFPSKNHLFGQMLDFLMVELEACALALEDETDTDRALERYIDFHCADCATYAPLLNVFASHAGVMDEENHEKIIAAMETDTHMLAAVLYEGKQAGKWRFSLSLTAMASLIQSLVLSAGRQGWIHGDKDRCDAMVADIQKLLQQA